jgi:hypothetical protein
MFAGETAEKTTNEINSARGGTMLVDEAYQLVPLDSRRDFGVEAIETIMATIEGGDQTTDDRPAYIFAGYPIEMERLLHANAGLKRRVTHTFSFIDYSPLELAEIFVKMCKKCSLSLEQKVTLCDVEQAICQFKSRILSVYNAGISNKLLLLCRDRINVRIVDSLRSGVVASGVEMKQKLITITKQDLVDSAKELINKLN